MNRLTVVQARMGSKRLPGKTLEMVGDKTVLEWVVHRVRAARLGFYVVATSTADCDDAIADLCARLHIHCYRGKEVDVLDRFQALARGCSARSVVRVTADCPLLCPVLLNRTVGLMGFRVDYAGVGKAPNGLGQEIISARALKDAWQHAKGTYDREHVVTYTMARPKQYRQLFVKPTPMLRERAHWRLTLDTANDLALLRRIYGLSHGRVFDWSNSQIVHLVEKDPECLELATAA